MSLLMDSGIDYVIGKRVRERREQLSLSLDEMAERCGVSRSMISRIERVESSATAALLAKISAGLGLTLSGLMAQAECPAHAIARSDKQRSWRDPETGYVRKMVSPAATGSDVELVEITLPVGARVEYPPWSTGYDQHVLVLRGRLTLGIGRERYELRPGDCIHMTLEQNTRFANDTRAPVRYLVVLKAPSRSGVAPLGTRAVASLT